MNVTVAVGKKSAKQLREWWNNCIKPQSNVRANRVMQGRCSTYSLHTSIAVSLYRRSQRVLQNKQHANNLIYFGVRPNQLERNSLGEATFKLRFSGKSTGGRVLSPNLFP